MYKFETSSRHFTRNKDQSYLWAKLSPKSTPWNTVSSRRGPFGKENYTEVEEPLSNTTTRTSEEVEKTTMSLRRRVVRPRTNRSITKITWKFLEHKREAVTKPEFKRIKGGTGITSDI